MAKSPDISNKIKALRTERGETQDQFATRLGVARPTVSGWESTESDIIPSADSYVRLGNLAPYPDNLWFWEQAGIEEASLLSAAGKILKERGELAENNSVAVPPLRQLASRPPVQQVLHYLDSRHVPNPGAVAYFEIESPTHRETGLLPGDIIFLDTSANDSPSLQPFWGQEVLVRVTEEVNQVSTARPRLGIHLGKLLLDNQGGHWIHAVWNAQLFPPRHTAGNLGSNSYGDILGIWNISMTSDTWRLRGKNREFDLDLVRQRAMEELRLYPGCTMLGRVIYPIRFPPKGEK